ncbi:MAG: autotransporter outer membrane beta-barrel domain-containing protein [Cyclobacteriaceae bacterium]|nr:autotransporter outer membrane beta-barrel domain-containing protein [Cyclobacteriaceae bacterium]MDH4297869.1 autotransporter outer membrane beta-barrel domain-containing protein [Cyclobacteriaceae bacterium]MDH5250206.1 autotransporter outer membrane beta-barrel domain-containing protein [Cyclobacteriaceae bacterium]
MKNNCTWLLCLALIGYNQALQAQDDCGQTLIQAERAYYTGRFGEVRTLLATCLASGFDKDQKTEAYRLIALSAIFSRNFERADTSLLHMLKNNPQYEFTPQDPPEFKKRVEHFKVHPLVEVTANLGVVQPFFKVNQVYNTRLLPAAVSYEGNTGVHIGLSANYYFTKNISARVGYEWQHYSFTIQNEDSLNTGLLTEKESRSQWQLALGYSYNLKKFSLQAYAGVAYATLQTADGYLVLNRNSSSDEIDFSYSTLPQRAKNQWRPLLELKVNLPQKDKWMFSLSVRYEFGIQNMTDADNRFSDPGRAATFEWIEDDFKSSTLLISFGISKLFYNVKLP